MSGKCLSILILLLVLQSFVSVKLLPEATAATSKIKDGKYRMSGRRCTGYRWTEIDREWKDYEKQFAQSERRLYQHGDVIVLERHRKKLQGDRLELRNMIAGTVVGDTVHLQEMVATDEYLHRELYAGEIRPGGKRIDYTYWMVSFNRTVITSPGSNYRFGLPWNDPARDEDFVIALGYEPYIRTIKCTGRLEWYGE